MHAATLVRGFARSWFWSLGIVVALLLPHGVQADNPPEPPRLEKANSDEVDGLFITVHNPITTNVVNRVKAKTERFLDRPDHRGLFIVYDFNPDSHPSGTKDYGPCHDLAVFLLGLHDITTIGFVHNEVTGHTVLPVLACNEIVMSKGGKKVRDTIDSTPAKIGDVLRDQIKPLEEEEITFYKRLADRRHRCPAIVLKMADSELPVVEGTQNGHVWYGDQRHLDKDFRLSRPDAAPILPAGSPGFYTVDQALKFDLCKIVLESREEVRSTYGLPMRSLREDPLDGRSPIARRIEIRGPVDATMAETIKRRMRRAIGGQGVNLFILQIDCGGGDTSVARDLADFFASLKDDHGQDPVMTIAFIGENARDTAAFLAFGCTEIVMAKNAKLGGFENYVKERPNHRDAILSSLEGLVVAQGHPAILARALLDPNIELHRVRSVKGRERTLLDGVTLKNDKEADKKWVDEGQIKPAGPWLEIDAELAKELNITRFVVDGLPADALQVINAHYGLENVRVAKLDWLDQFAFFLQEPVVGFFLVMIGITGLILELKIPGVSFPGIVAAVCFVLFFWAHSQLNGTLTMLAVLLFMLGLILIGLEVFVVPGFGVTGISGITLVIGSLALATLVKKPETNREWLDFGTTLSQFGFSMIAAMVVAFVVAWYLPTIPYVNRLVLVPPSEVEQSDDSEYAAGAFFPPAALLGAIGEAATTLRPAGKVRFGDAFVDVVAEGSYVQPGARVQVIEIEGNRIVVKEV